MKKTLFILLFSVMVVGPAFSQIKMDVELQKLVNVVTSLRTSEEAAWKAANDILAQDELWTAMDEAPKHGNETWLIGARQFRLNKIHNDKSGYDKKMTPGEFLNGNDPHYNYSMTERGVKAGATVSYSLSHRSGRQTFVVIPYDKGSKDIEVGMFRNGETTGQIVQDAEGNLIVSIDENVQSGDMLRIDITNHGATDMPVVIINHNTRKY